MNNILGFLLINIYAFLLIISTSIIFFSKQRLKQTEDEVYKKFLISNIFISLSGLILGIVVTPLVAYNPLIIMIFNKLYLISLFFWIYIFTFYVVYISLKNKNNVNKYQKIFNIICSISLFLIIIFPIEVQIASNGSATSSGLSVILTYVLFAIGFIVQIVYVLSNYKNLKNKKYIPVYMLILIGAIILVSQIINPSLNYLINPGLIFVAYIMYHTIENPDLKMIEELQKTRKLNEKANNDKSNFLFNLTQDVRQPISRVKEICDIAILENDPEVLKEGIREIKSVSNEFDRLVNNVLDVSSIDAKNLKISNHKYNVNKLLKSVELGVKSNISKEVEFRTNINSNIPEELFGDDIKLKQILTTVLLNSIEYTKEGFIDFRVDSVIRHNICRLIITVEDSGVGMGVRQINNILEANEELTEEELNKLDNKNLNLNIIKKLVSLIGGNINIESHEGKGSIFSITLDQKISEEEGTDFATTYKGKKKVLLVVETDEIDKELEKDIDKSRYEVERVNMAKTCLDKIRDGEDYDYILVEQDMTKINHKQLIHKLKDIDGFNIPIYLIGDTDLSQRQEILEMGYKTVIDKNINKNEVNSIFE